MNDPVRELARQIERLSLAPKDAQQLVEGHAGGLSDERSLALVALDVGSVQSHIFASPRPVTIQGASDVLRAWDATLRAARLKEEGGVLGAPAVALFAGGGTATLLVREEHRRDIEADLRTAFRHAVPGAACTLAHVRLSPQDLAAGPSASPGAQVPEAIARRAGWRPHAEGFGGCIARLHAELRRQRESAGPHPFLTDANALAPRCVECTSRPRTRGERCEVCLRHREEGANTKAHWDSARNFDEVLAGGRQLAYLKLDGKGIGAMLEGLETMAQYRAVSELLCEAFEVDATTLLGLGAPLERDVQPGAKVSDRELRLQRPIAGGDDLLLIVPAQWERDASMAASAANDALTLGLRLAQRVESTVTAWIPRLEPLFQPGSPAFERVRQLGVGMGVLITNALPASYCFEVVDKLVDSSKDLLDGKLGAPRSAVDFAVVHGGSMLSSSLQELRERETSKRDDGHGIDLGAGLVGDLRVTRKPYALPDFEELLRVVGRLPRERAGLYNLRRAMQAPGPGMIAVRYQVARDSKLRSALFGSMPLGELPKHLGPWIMSPHKDDWATAVPDLLEVVRVVAPSDRAEDE